MKKSLLTMLALATAAALPASARADDVPASDFTVTGNVTGISQYRLRGISLSDEKPAIQGSITGSHVSGFYASVWASSLAGYGTFGGANIEVDAIAGYTKTVGSTALDGGLVWFFFPGTSGHQFSEIYGSVSHPIGPVRAKLGANYAIKRRSIGDSDNLWVYGDLSLPVKGTPIALRGHIGYTDGKGSIFSGPRGHYIDYAVGADLSWRNLTFSLAYTGTDINSDEADAYFTYPGTKSGRDIVNGTALISVTAAF